MIDHISVCCAAAAVPPPLAAVRGGDALGREAPAGAGEAEQIAGVGERACDDQRSLVGRGGEEVAVLNIGLRGAAAGGGRHLH
eukprot:COSAG06_NODE_4956_length_3832_cov_17.189660_3_plen_83_part_00